MKLSVFEGLVALVSTIYTSVVLTAVIMHAFKYANFTPFSGASSEPDMLFIICKNLFYLSYLVIIYFAFRIGRKKLITWKLKEKIITVLSVAVGIPISISVLIAIALIIIYFS